MPGDMIPPIRIEGLSELKRSLRTIDRNLPKGIRVAANASAGIVVDWARPRIPLGRTGKARRSLRATSTQSAARITGGGARAPYYPWLDFGGHVGRRRSVARPFIKPGRYIYPGFATNIEKIRETFLQGLIDVVEQAGINVG